MKKFIFLVLAVLVLPILFSACAHTKDPMLTITNAPDQGGEIPIGIVEQASDQYGGSMISTPAPGARSGETGSIPISGRSLTVVLGPVNVERLGEEGDKDSDAGQGIREIISQRLTADGKITLFDAPEERFIDDSPRPDLARKGVRCVIKGIASQGADTGEVTVFLRAVDTLSGKVIMVASARSTSRDTAAGDATKRLTTKIMEAMQ